MRLRCKSCGAQIEARDVTLAALKALCPACGSKFHFGQEDVPALGLGISGEAEALLPRHYKAEVEGDTLIIKRSWRDGPLDWMAYVILAWYALLGAGLWQNWRSTLPVAQSFQLYMLVVILAVVGALGVYALLQGIFNSTTITVSPRALRVTHGPIRFSRKRALDWDFSTPSPQIRQIFARMSVNPAAAPSIHGGYDLHVILHSGVHEVALFGMTTEDEAKFVSQRIRKHLNLPRMRVESRPTPEQVPRPEKIEVEITAETLRMTYRFGTLRSLSPSLFVCIAGLVILLILVGSQAVEGRPIGWLNWPIAPLAAGELLLVLCTLRLAVRRHCMRLNKEALRIDAWPASLGQARLVPVSEIAQVFCTSRPRLFRPPWRTGSAAELVYEVWTLSPRDKRTRFLSNLASSDEAFFIEQEIERHLGLEDAVVRGESTRPGSAKALDLQRQLNQRHDLLSALRLEASYTIGQKYPPSLPKLLQLYQSTEDPQLLENAARILQLPQSELERLIWEFEETGEIEQDELLQGPALELENDSAPSPTLTPGPIPKSAITKRISAG